jgi:hypothetical protein
MALISVGMAENHARIAACRRYADDPAPTPQEICKITEYPDRCIKPIVYIMASSGIRVGAWDYLLQWGHITPI